MLKCFILQHMCYEVSGTCGAFASSAAISKLGNNYSFLITPGTSVIQNTFDATLTPIGSVLCVGRSGLADVRRPSQHHETFGGHGTSATKLFRSGLERILQLHQICMGRFLHRIRPNKVHL